MGFALTLYYLLSTFLTPAEVMPALLPYRIMLVLLLLTLAASTFTMLGSGFSFKAPQLILLFALVADVAVSVLWSVRWLAGALDATLDLLFLAGIVLMVAWNVTSASRLRKLTYLLVAVGVLISLQGIIGLETGYRREEFVLNQHDVDEADNPIQFDRIRGLGVLNDPNDLGQFLLIDLALLTCCWKKKSLMSNLVPVILPSVILLTGILLTRSRGTILGLIGFLILIFQKRLGKFGLVLASVAGVAGLGAMVFLTDRSVSMSEGSAAGRLDAWYAGMQMLKGSPIFGVGFNQFTEHHFRTAHNSYMLCVAELGFPGFFLWLGMIVASVFQMRAVSLLPGEGPEIDELKQSGRSVYVALLMFGFTGWFLSRAFTTILFVLIGCAIAVTEMTLRSGVEETAKPKVSWAMVTAATAVVFLAFVDILLRIRGVSS
ncbi:MAG: O-antigen ligase family protein [Acidobacteriota bacterium]|nr:O-antigen ligase family protein [Acidobacteriota bacterium]